jgi:hypothetical protein
MCCNFAASCDALSNNFSKPAANKGPAAGAKPLNNFIGIKWPPDRMYPNLSLYFCVSIFLS